jgi:SSS family solute:Na+ symporter
MTMLASDLNSLASVATTDFYRAFRPKSTDGERLRAAKFIVVVVGLLNIVTALILVQTKGSALSMWFAVSAIASGGLAGLFLLAFLMARSNRLGIYVGIAASTVFTVWAVLTKGAKPLVNLGGWNFPFDELTIGAFGNIVLFVVGAVASLLLRGRDAVNPGDAGAGTVWHWLRHRHARDAQKAA